MPNLAGHGAVQGKYITAIHYKSLLTFLEIFVATIENRSRFCITVKNRPDLTRYFPFSKLKALDAYMNALRAQNLKPRAEQLDESWLLRVRQTGYKDIVVTHPSQQAAESFLKKVEEERTRGLFVDYTKAHKATFAELLIRYLENEVQRVKSRDMLAYKIEGWLVDSGDKGIALLDAHRTRERAAGNKVRPARFTTRALSTELDWIHKRLSDVVTVDIESFIRERLETVAPSTVDREIDILKSVFKVAITVWDYTLAKNPMDAVRRPNYFNERDRRITRDEEGALVQALASLDRERAVEERLKELADEALAGQHFTSNSARKKVLADVRKTLQRLAEDSATVIPYLETFYHFQVMTAGRRGETLGLTWNRIDFDAGTAFLPETKNGRARKLSLRSHLMALLKELPHASGPVFAVSIDYLVGAWARACKMVGLVDFHIHDLRHLAITNVAQTGQFTLPELQQFSGHRDIRMLMRYAHLCASRLAQKLDECFKNDEMVRGHRGRSFLNKHAPVSVQQVLAAEAPLPEERVCQSDGVALLDKTVPHRMQAPATATNVIAFPKRKQA